MLINLVPKEILGKTATKINLVVINWDKIGYPLSDAINVAYSLQDSEGNSIANDNLTPPLIGWDKTLDWLFEKCIEILNLEKS